MSKRDILITILVGFFVGVGLYLTWLLIAGIGR